ncbi:carbohydrate ABC transporter permease [Georgenia ruanii]|uniref:ABC transporter permease subunit n=1 Tax=Georgenia ruanii TaxID=348442 RepID=A0A7J9UYP2_9MICO|nr:carbohydrate ABC transporter permease [Georgenia ruanii]MPV89010.1 ABC transporter permease subunit [Georgenia ruanii]
MSLTAPPRDARPAPALPGPDRPRRTRRRDAGPGRYAVMVLAVLVLGVPLLWMLLAGFKQPDELYTVPLRWLPHGLDLSNYAEATSLVPMGTMFLNSVGITLVGAAGEMLLGLGCAYALVFLDIPFKRAIFVAVIFTLLIPQQITIIPNYTLTAELGWINTYQGIIVPGLSSAFGTFLFRQHFLTLPASILEAAELDGAGHWRKLFQFIVPMSAPTIAAVGVVSVVGKWNEYLWPFLVTDDPDKMTLPVGLTLLQKVDGMQDWGLLMAATSLVTLPMVVVFLVLQRRLVSGLTAGAVTG